MAQQLKAVIFDMDGVLIDSEPYWQQAELQVFSELGVPLTFEDTLKTQGLRIDKVVEYWYWRHPWDGPGIDSTSDEILTRVATLVAEQGEALAGVHSAIAAIRSQGLALGLATSSPSRLIAAVLARLGLTDTFDATLSAEHLPHGKPHPQVYLDAAAALGVAATECLAIEDSFNGLLSAKSAQMRALAIPDAHHQDDPRFVIADHRLPSLVALTPEWLNALD
ncbi:hexitol phosphatase HxpB [Ferrimonas balearica]|uniref:hexitol phosphatase HxpB n=1 Tax=Ferrimonas balearica TaxID=44012 RepID=UPI001C990C4F|nr:hexitol phosphatase HxpB [Ferrimonas balearica]MBY5992148.1 hexitol phosphatase HxpB [Ferrimonas balearica]